MWGANIGFLQAFWRRARVRKSLRSSQMFKSAGSLERHARLNSLSAKIEVIRAAVFFPQVALPALEPADTSRGHGNAHVWHPNRAFQVDGPGSLYHAGRFRAGTHCGRTLSRLT